jgi:hypothetical protein
LPGAGKPLALDRNPFAGDKSLAYSLLNANHTQRHRGQIVSSSAPARRLAY